jgi:rhodanese-related sulfurtransferase
MTTTLTLPDPAQAREFFQAWQQFTTGPVELDQWITGQSNINIIDVRDSDDYAKGHIPGALNLPREKWSTFAGLSRDKVNVLYCYTQTCHLASEACLLFASNGYPVKELKGGFAAWKAADLRIERPSFTERLRKAA